MSGGGKPNRVKREGGHCGEEHIHAVVLKLREILEPKSGDARIVSPGLMKASGSYRE